MKLRFYEQCYNLIEIDEDTFNEYLNTCREADITPFKDDFMDWLSENYYMCDFIDESSSEIEYTLTDKQFNRFLEEFEDND